jgi:hypothetical protein
MKAKVIFLIRLGILACLYFISFAVISSALIPASTHDSSVYSEANVLFSLLALALLNSVVFGYLVLRSRLAGWKLALNLFVIFFGASTFMPQMETAVFITQLPPGMLPRIVISGLVHALIFCLLAVLVLGKGKDSGANHKVSRLQMPARQWLLRLTIIAVAYVIIYLTFGYFLAWRNSAVLAYYRGTDPGNFFSQVKSVLQATPWLPPFQFARGLLWATLAVPVIRMMKGPWWEAGLAVALCFAVTSAQLLLPNPVMPREVRMAHLLETATSNFLFGWLVVFLLVKWRTTSSLT